MSAMSEVFVSESRELVQQATDDLIALEREGFTVDRVDRIFRAFHTLKGSAGLVSLPAMGVMMHAAEELIAALRAELLDATPAIIDQALACLDVMSRWIDAFEVDGALPPDADAEGRVTTERLRALLAGQAGQSETRENQAGFSGDQPVPAWVAQLIEAEQAQIADRLRLIPGALFAISYEPNADCYFNGDDPIDLMRRVPDLLACHIEARAPWPATADLDPYRCNLRLRGISAAPRDALRAIFQFVSDQTHIVEIPAVALRPGEGAKAQDAETAVMVRALVEEQRRILAVPHGGGEDLIGRINAAGRAGTNVLRHALRPELASRVEDGRSAATAEGNVAPLVRVLDEVLAALTPPAAGSSDGLAPSAGARASGTETGARLLRVEEAKVDALFNLASELIVVKNSIAHLVTRAAAEDDPSDLVRMFRRAQESVERVAGDIHGAILQLRMVPVAQVFRSFPRLVRDMAQTLHKKVRLVTGGDATECDKTIVDRLSEPLLHLVRNALDHGIEEPAQRRDAGKPEAGTITVQASRTGDRFILEVSDDGRGIDPVVVRQKAQERHLLAEEALSALSDDQVVDLIFSAGFSTKAEISEISGRGVGMDVVRTAIERVGGRVSVTSRVGEGTRVRLDLPMTIAMSHIMVVEVGGQVFGLPMDAVSETVRLAPDRISRIKNNDGFVLRDRVVPICSLAELMNMPPAPPPAGVRLFVVTEGSGGPAALEIDAIRDRIEVVLKPMQGLLTNASGYAGTTLLGDGSVLLVLDLKEIVP